MKQFIYNYLYFLFLIPLIFCGTNLVVDPYDLFDLINVQGFNRVKPYTRDNDQIHKPVTLYRINPEVVILGSSITQLGIDPNEVERITGLRAYNFGIDGPTMYEIHSFFNFAVQNTNAKKMIVVIDFMMFSGARGLYNSRYNYDRMQMDLSKGILGYLSPKEMVKVFLSTSTFIKSLQTVFKQSGQSYYDDLGFIRKQNVLRENPINYVSVFYESKKAYINFFDFQALNKDWYTTPEGISLFESFRMMVAETRENGIGLSIVLSPVNVFFMEELQSIKKLGPIFLEWKKNLREIILEENKTLDKNNLIKFFDYTSSNDQRNHETIPEPYTDHMFHWNDAYHFSIHYGNEIIRDIF